MASPTPLSDMQDGKKPRGKVKKPYLIESRMLPGNFGWSGVWGVWQRYRTAAQRDQALQTLIDKQVRTDNGIAIALQRPIRRWIEYRARDES